MEAHKQKKMTRVKRRSDEFIHFGDNIGIIGTDVRFKIFLYFVLILSIYCAKSEYSEQVDIDMERNKDIVDDFFINYALHYRRNNIERLNNLIYNACSRGHLERLKFLCYNIGIWYAKLLIEGQHNAALKIACFHRHLHIVEYLRSQIGIDKSYFKQSYTIFLDACRCGHLDVVKYLFENAGLTKKDIVIDRLPCILSFGEYTHLNIIQYLIQNAGFNVVDFSKVWVGLSDEIKSWITEYSKPL